jgi:hypothetical protein
MKKRQIYLFLLLSIVGWLTLPACRKQKNASGQILEFGTEKPIANATATLRSCEGEVLGNFTCSDIATMQTDANGNFEFDSDGTTIAAEAADYWPSGDDFAFINRKDGCPVPATMHLFPHAWLKVTIRNESGAYGFFPPSNSSSSPLIHISIDKDSIIDLIFVKGNQNLTYQYGVFDVVGSTGVYKSSSFFCSAKDTTNLSIIY